MGWEMVLAILFTPPRVNPFVSHHLPTVTEFAKSDSLTAKIAGFKPDQMRIAAD